MSRSPLATRMRPTNLDEIVGQTHILAPGALLYRMIQADQLFSIILYGPPGTGKTTIANVIANTTGKDFRQINATTASKTDMRSIVEHALKLFETKKQDTILFIDEIHRFNKAQQDYLLPYVENGTITLIGATTENPYFEVNGALLSRSRIFELKPLSSEDIVKTVKRALADKTNGYGNRNDIVITDETIQSLAHIVDGDVRQALNALELAIETTNPAPDGITYITDDVIANSTQKKIMRFDKNGDNHYDFISAFIESMRHSEVDASLYYLARMLEAGEDPKYIARRLIAFASCDVGLADPQALDIAVNTFLAVERIGMPVCQSTLAMSTIYNATAPKCNSAEVSIAAAIEDVQATGNIQIPAFLQDESYKSAHKLGRGGVSDIYQTPGHYDGTDCMPPELKGRMYYKPQGFGYELTIQQYINWCESYRQKINESRGV